MWRERPIIAESTFKASQKSATVGDYGQKGWNANFGCYGVDKELNDNHLTIHVNVLMKGLSLQVQKKNL